MQKLSPRMVPAEETASPPFPAFKPLTPTLAPAQTKLLLVSFRSGEAVHQHPEVAPYLKQGWRIRSAVPRIVESKGTQLLVVLSHTGRIPALPTLE